MSTSWYMEAGHRVLESPAVERDLGPAGSQARALKVPRAETSLLFSLHTCSAEVQVQHQSECQG